MKQEFKPKYYTGLDVVNKNPEIDNLIDKIVEFSDNGIDWTKDELCTLFPEANAKFSIKDGLRYAFIRTCKETDLTPMINWNGHKLPKPENDPNVIADDDHYWVFISSQNLPTVDTWTNHEIDYERINLGVVHRTEAAARKWCDWWQEAVVKRMK